ncbi:MAG TPA: hypothetical protein VIG45_02790 [Erysipelothrix sp.]
MSELIMNANNDESKLISGKEALESILEGLDVQYLNAHSQWDDSAIAITVMDFLDCKFKFRLKPKTITINGIEVPAPFKPKEDVIVWILNDSKIGGYQKYDYEVEGDDCHTFIGAWRTEEEIKQVVPALRQVFEIKK